MSGIGWEAVAAGAVAAALSGVLTPVSSRLARRVGAVDEPRARGLSDKPTPRLGGLAILAGVVVAALIFLPVGDERYRAILAGAILIALVGAVDDVIELHPAVKLLGQAGAATLPVLAGVEVTRVTVPFIGGFDLGDMGGPLTVLFIVAVANVVNFSDGIDGLAAGVCAISAASFAVIAFDLQRDDAGVLAAITAGAALGFLFHNFYPATAFMGDSGSNLLGYLLGVIAVEGAVKTQAVLALIFPLIVLAVPFLDTTFVVLKRMKYRRPVYQADANHFHHRFSRIGFSQRRTVLYLYAWTLLLGGSAIALRFVPYSDNGGDLHLGWAIVMAAILLAVLAASVYLVYVLEILKFRGITALRRGRTQPDEESDEDARRQMETGEFDAIRTPAQRP